MKNHITFLLLFTLSFFGYSQSGNIQGVITDENGVTVPGATVSIKELNKGTVSDFDGKFTLVDVAEGTHNVLVSFIGYANVEKEVTIIAEGTVTLNVTMNSESTELEEVLITGYGLGGQARALNTQKNKTFPLLEYQNLMDWLQ